MLAVTADPTGLVLTVKVAVVAPAATVTLAGIVAAALSLDNVTIEPSAGAALLRVTVAVAEEPPVKLDVSKLRDETVGGLSVSVAVCVPLKTPPMLTVVMAATAVLVTWNVVVVSPSATLALAGTVAATLSEESETTAPPAGATPSRITVPVDELPPAMLAGFTEIEVSVGALTVKAAVLVIPSRTAERVRVAVLATAVVLILKLAVVAPAATLTFAGTVAAALSLERAAIRPPAGAAPVRVTVPVEELPPITEAGLTLMEERAGGFTVSDAVWVPL
jgi:hypothetical protein